MANRKDGSKPSNHGVKWTKAELSKLRSMAKKGDSTTKISKELKSTESAIRSKANEKNIRLSPPN